jgi:copper homeostasis protein
VRGKGEGRLLFEVCVDSVTGVRAAAAGGADRVELCSGLVEGGITPSHGTIRRALEVPGIACVVLVRPRGGDFLYDQEEFAVMQEDIQAIREAGAFGVAVGVLQADGTLDIERMRDLVEAARPMQVTCHRAFDMARDPFEALAALLDLGVDRVLTSGRQRSVVDGLDLVRELVRQAGKNLSVMPGSGIRADNVRRVLEATGAREVHFTAFTGRPSPMTYRNLAPRMGAEAVPGEYERLPTDPDGVRAVIAAAGRV